MYVSSWVAFVVLAPVVYVVPVSPAATSPANISLWAIRFIRVCCTRLLLLKTPWNPQGMSEVQALKSAIAYALVKHVTVGKRDR